MKTLKKLMAFMLCFVMMFTVIPTMASAISDDVLGTNYEDAAYLLGALNIMVGDAGTGAFRPEDTITRAEFAKVVVVAKGLEDLAKSSTGYSNFPDVDVEFWGTGYINVAAGQKLVIGFEDGTFRPNDKIQYQDVITILVRALGYEPAALEKGGYPNGYLAIAAQKGMTKNANGAPASDVIRGTVANLLFNSLTINLMEQSGFGDNATHEETTKTLLKDVLNVESGKAQITANGYSTLSEASGLDKDSVVVDGKTYKEGNSNAGAFLGYYVNYYAKEDDNGINKTLILVRPEKSRNKTINVQGENIASASETELQYWKDKDNDSTTQKAKISATASMIYNGVGITFDASKMNDTLEGVVKLLEVTGDETYDVVFVDEVTNLVVEDVIESSFKIADKYGNDPLTLDPDDAGYSFILQDSEGNKLELSDLLEWDVITYTVSDDDSLIIATVSRESVSGKVTEISQNKYRIGDNQYEIASNYTEGLQMEDEGIFYLDIYGRIAAVNKSSREGSNYAFLINAGMDGVLDQVANFRILTANGELVTLKGTDKIRFNGDPGKTGEYVIDELSKTVGESKVVEQQLLTITINSNDKISEISTATDNSVTQKIDKYDFAMNFKADDVKYKANSSKLGRYRITDETVIFDIPAGKDSEDYTVREKAMFENDSLYNVLVYDVSEDLTAGVVIVTNSEGLTSLESPLAVVNRITTVRNDEGMTVQRVYLAYDGAMVSYDTEESDILRKGENKEKELEAGDIIQLKLNSKGNIENFTLLLDIEAKGNEDSDAKDKMAWVYGQVDKKFASSINVSVNGGLAENYDTSNAKVYLYNSSKTSNKVSVATAADIERYDNNAQSRVFVRLYDDVVKEIVIIK